MAEKLFQLGIVLYIKRGNRVAAATKKYQLSIFAYISPYGYIKDKDDKNQWIIDEKAAEVVRRIFI